MRQLNRFHQPHRLVDHSVRLTAPHDHLCHGHHQHETGLAVLALGWPVQVRRKYRRGFTMMPQGQADNPAAEAAITGIEGIVFPAPGDAFLERQALAHNVLDQVERSQPRHRHAFQ